ncbi:hypothetical protein Drose_21640 [Dactylosporangium roseum]|uniref:Uncharacterized protein n=1 Tax=Dactylosporangium roseum TaxID=47989 RepID=A0ABY5YZ85_9ACTN|nr:hypothetical protein [Dactylosporangium roseum]UWZ33873.1 hypothetical protein Drose_21640 [Dactylosporangium roseum]
MSRGLVFRGVLAGPDDVAALWRQAGTAAVETLDVTGTRCSDAALAALLAEPRAQRIRSLVLDDNPITDAGLAELGDPGRLPDLAALSLRRTGIGDAGATILAALDQPLRSLHLDDAGVRAGGLAAIGQASWLDRLEELTLSVEPGTRLVFGADLPRPGQWLATAGLRSLRRCDLSGCYVSESDVAALTGAAHLATLTELHLNRVDLNDRAAYSITNSRALANLTALYLAGNRLRHSGAQALAGSPHLRALRVLDVTGNPIDGPGIMALVRSTALAGLAELRCGWGLVELDDWPAVVARFPALSMPPDVRRYHEDSPDALDEALDEATRTGSLSLRMVRLGAASWELLRADPRFAAVERLALHRNQLGDEGAAALAGNGALTRLTHLELVDNGIGATGVRALTSGVPYRSVRHLDLSGNRIGAEGIATLLGPSAAALRELVLRRVPGPGLAALPDLPGLDGLDVLDLSDNDMSDIDREYYDWAGPPVHTVPADAVAVALRERLGCRLRL